MDYVIPGELVALAERKTGIKAREEDKNIYRRAITHRMKYHRMKDPGEYLSLLGCDDEDISVELEALTNLLVSTETYFLRDAGQMRLLRNRILPEIIKNREDEKKIRICSAGCSTGEEAYSLAMLLDELITFREGWNIQIIGIDINEESIEKAGKGLYGDWSFRKVPAEVKNLYFRHKGNRWQLNDRIRKMVTFRACSLMEELKGEEKSLMTEMDLILCRNVFIYMNRDAILKVLGRLTGALRKEGYLMTGHAELYGLPLGRLKSLIFPDSIIYQNKVGSALEEKSAYPPLTEVGETGAIRPPVRDAEDFKPSGIIKMVELPSSPANATSFEGTDQKVGDLFTRAKELMYGGAYPEAIEEVMSVVTDAVRNPEALYLMARAQANLGDYDGSEQALRKAIELNPLESHFYYLLAHISQERGDIDGARDMLQKVIYLAPSFIAAYLDLASIYEREDNRERSGKMRHSALGLLKELPPDSYVEPYTTFTVSELMRYLEDEIKK